MTPRPPTLTEEQFEALKDWIEAVAYAKARAAVHQPTTKGTIEYAEERAHRALVETEDNE